MTAIILTEKLCKTFSNQGTQQHVIRNLDFSIYEGDFTVVMGSSGSGKSTLLYAISGMDQPTLGTIHYCGETDPIEITHMTNDQLALFRRANCGFIFQQIHLMDNMSALDNILTNGLLLTGNKKALAGRAKEMLLAVGLEESLWHKFPSQLSGGEAQRVGIVRALINKPRVLFADEPTGALNSASALAVLDVMTALHQQGQNIVLVTHDLKTACRGNRIVYLRDGAIVGELKMTAYNHDDKARSDKLQTFLERMGW